MDFVPLELTSGASSEIELRPIVSAEVTLDLGGGGGGAGAGVSIAVAVEPTPAASTPAPAPAPVEEPASTPSPADSVAPTPTPTPVVADSAPAPSASAAVTSSGGSSGDDDAAAEAAAVALSEVKVEVAATPTTTTTPAEGGEGSPPQTEDGTPDEPGDGTEVAGEEKKRKKKKSTLKRKQSAVAKEVAVLEHSAAGADLTFESLTADLKVHIVELRQLAVVAAIVHMLVTIFLFVMGYSSGGAVAVQRCELARSCEACRASTACGWCGYLDDGVCYDGAIYGSSTNDNLCYSRNASTPASPAIWSYHGQTLIANCPGSSAVASPMTVVCAFGALATCVFACTALYHTFTNTQDKTVTRPKWHKQEFFAAVVRGFFLIFFQWPGLVSYIMHSLGADVNNLLADLGTAVRTTEIIHIIIFMGVAAVDVFAFSYASTKLGEFRQTKDEQEKLQGEEKDEDLSVLASSGEEEHKTVTTQDKLLASGTIVAYLLLVADLVNIAVRSLNSGTIVSVLAHLILLAIFAFYLYQVLKPITVKTYSKPWVLNYRVFTVVHLTAMVVAFWVCFVILLLIEHYNTEFFKAVFSFGNSRTVFCILELLLFVACVIVYGLTLRSHQKALNLLDELGGLNLISRTKA